MNRSLDTSTPHMFSGYEGPFNTEPWTVAIQVLRDFGSKAAPGQVLMLAALVNNALEHGRLKMDVGQARALSAKASEIANRLQRELAATQAAALVVPAPGLCGPDGRPLTK
jgi:hypothetical protein